MPDEKGETRRERNERAEHPTPDVIIPPAGWHLWEWYQDACYASRRITEGVCGPISPLEWEAWARLHGTIVRPSEWAILRAIDAAWCAETNKELAAFRVRQTEAADKPDGGKQRRRGRWGR